MKNSLLWWIEFLVHTIRFGRLELIKIEQDDGSFVRIYVIPDREKKDV